MGKWEYQVIQYSRKNITGPRGHDVTNPDFGVPLLNEEGADGWELTSAHPHPDFPESRILFYFKRWMVR